MKAKHIIRMAVPIVLGSLLLTSCDDEPAVGTPLNPVAEENYGPKAYIYEGGSPTNTSSTTVVQTPVSLVLPTDTFKVYVKLTSAVQHDVNVSLAVNDSASNAYGSDVVALSAACLNVINPSVVIKAGETQSEEPVRITLQDNDAYKSLSGQGVAVLKLSVDSKDVALAQEYNYFNVLVNKEITNLKSQSSDELAELTQISTDKYSVYADGSYTEDLSDNNTSTYYYAPAPYEIMMVFEEAQNVAACSYQFGYSRYYSPTEVEILTSEDGDNWTSQTGGEKTSTVSPRQASEEVPWIFYSPVNCKYIKFRMLNCYYGQWGSWYNTPIVSEVKLYQ